MNNSTILILTASAFSAAIGQLLFKAGARNATQWLDFLNVHILIGLILYASATATWIYSLSIAKLVNVYAFTALTFVLVYTGSAIILGERISVAGVFGILLIMIGLYLITSFNS